MDRWLGLSSRMEELSSYLSFYFVLINFKTSGGALNAMRGTPSFLKMKNILYIIFGLMAISIVSCQDSKKGEKDKIIVRDNPRMDYGMERTHQDTVALMDLAKQYLEALKTKNIEGALDQLYEIENGVANPLSSERRNELRKAISAFPVESYSIDAVILYSDSDSEVRYTTKMFPDSVKSEMPGETKGSLHPFRVDSQWYLTIQQIKHEN